MSLSRSETVIWSIRACPIFEHCTAAARAAAGAQVARFTQSERSTAVRMRGIGSARDKFSYVAKAFSEISTSRSPVSLLKQGQNMLVPAENATIMKYNNRLRYK